jgi:hypothetical protein
VSLRERGLSGDGDSALRNLTSLVNLRHLALCRMPGLMAPQALSHLTTLRQFLMPGCAIGPRLDAVASLTNLVELDLARNALCSLNVAPLQQMIALYVTNNPLKELKGLESLTNLCTLFVRNQNESDHVSHISLRKK